MTTRVQYLSPPLHSAEEGFQFPEYKKLEELLRKEFEGDRAFDFILVGDEKIYSICKNVATMVQGKFFSMNDTRFVKELWTQEFIRLSTPLEGNMSNALINIRQKIIENLPLFPKKEAVVSIDHLEASGCCTIL